ncbi:MAG: hypothetical protein ACE145_08215 [Terriglobia bacterium]
MIESIRGGKVPEVIRRKGAEGTLSLPLTDKLEILVFLARDKDETISTTALNTLLAWDPAELVPVASNPSTSVGILEFVAHHLTIGRKDLMEALLGNPSLPIELRDFVKLTSTLDQQAASAPPTEAGAPVEEAAGDGQPKERITLLQRIGRMSAAEKIKTALTGNQEERLVLIRDSNKIVARAVLQSPKLSDMEIENIASMKNVTEEVLRLIAMNRKFMKSYAVMRQLINNPRLPIDVALPLLGRLNERDLKGLTLNKNVAEVVRGMATKIVKAKEEANKPKLPGKKH